MNRFSLLVAGCGIAWTIAAGAKPPTPDLPPLEQVAAAIEAHPTVSGARAGIGLEEANRRRLIAGPYETSARVMAQSRHDSISSRNLGEWDFILERGLRLPGKTALDQRLGEQAVDQARLAVGDARHEAGRTLLRMWFGWLKAATQAGHWEAQRRLLARQSEVMARRVQLGDAPRQEAWLAEAALAQAEVALAQAAMRVEIAAGELSTSYPQVKLPLAIPLTEPAALGNSAAYWLARIAEHNHELALARGEALRRRTAAERARAERTPDPTFGVRVGSERAGAERVVGLVLAIPFAGPQRAAAQDAAIAQTEIAERHAAAVERRLAAESAAIYAAASRAHSGWRLAQAAADAMERNAELTARAQRLGEANLTDLLAAQRLAIEARLAASVVRLEAAEARYRLLLDAHELWDLDEP